MNPRLEWELNWIRNNLHRYDSELHVQAVSMNIVRSYHIRELEAKLAKAKIGFDPIVLNNNTSN